MERVLSAYAKQASRPLTILDLGGGDGENIPWLLKYAARLHGSDYNLARLFRAARVPGVQQVVMADVTDYPANDNAFDVIFFNHVLEHIPEDEQALSEVRRILKPGDLVVLGVPNEGAWFWQLAYRLQPKMLKTSDHAHFYTAELLRKKCVKAGFTVQEVYPIGWGVPHWTLDALLRRFRWVDDAFEAIGRVLLPSQTTSLYLVLST